VPESGRGGAPLGLSGGKSDSSHNIGAASYSTIDKSPHGRHIGRMKGKLFAQCLSQTIDGKSPICDSPQQGNVAEKVVTSPACRVPGKRRNRDAPDPHGNHESESKLMPYDSLQTLSKRQLINALRHKPCVFDDVDLQVLTDATARRLRLLLARAREGQGVDEASEFARWVLSSGLWKLFDATAKACVKKLVDDTSRDCEAHWKNDGRGPWVAKSELEALNEKMDALMERIGSAEISPRTHDTAAQATYGRASGARLQVITGGLLS